MQNLQFILLHLETLKQKSELINSILFSWFSLIVSLSSLAATALKSTHSAENRAQGVAVSYKIDGSQSETDVFEEHYAPSARTHSALSFMAVDVTGQQLLRWESGRWKQIENDATWGVFVEKLLSSWNGNMDTLQWEAQIVWIEIAIVIHSFKESRSWNTEKILSLARMIFS